MANLLYLVHRLPYPPNKGDKVRSYHLLKHLASSNNVYLGTFVDDPDDLVHLPFVESLCTDLYVASLSGWFAKVRSLAGLLTGEPLTLPYYRDARLQNWVTKILAEKSIDAIMIFSSTMTQYVPQHVKQTVLVDFVDLDSAKWTQFAPDHQWPMSWIYRREGERLLRYECQIAQSANCAFFITENEAELFHRLAPNCQANIEIIMNGVDADFFNPQVDMVSPFSPDTINIVFTGAMDYWPNIDAVCWFAKEIFPALRTKWSQLNFYIVGRNPTLTVENLTGHGVIVTGTVPDVRPYLKYANIVVAPMRIARGVQNKILEAMAMGRPVVTATPCADAIGAKDGEEIVASNKVKDFISSIEALLSHMEIAQSIGVAARNFVKSRYSWEAQLTKVDSYLN